MAKTEKLQIRPYARLLTMLGEQLIKDERIALVELIKNAYDADADWVKITFQGFGDDYEVLEGSKIIIEDNGHGMTKEIIKEHWLNPGTPEKKRRKKEKTKKGREMQGEKGIGRFAILKLGGKIDVITRAAGEEKEHVIGYDFSMYDDDFIQEKKYQFLDDIEIPFTSRVSERIIDSEINLGNIIKSSRSEHGTIIEISNLKGYWNSDKVKNIHDDLIKLSPIFPYNEEKDFVCYIYKDNKFQNFGGKYLERLEYLCSEASVIKIEEGEFDSEQLEYKFKINNMQRCIRISDEDTRITGLKFFRDKFGDVQNIQNNKNFKGRCKEIGNFKFSFHIFDLSNRPSVSDRLPPPDKELIKQHRIYLYRDGIRVYPYGNLDDDWLGIDVHRGTIRAGDFLSNDQVVGIVNITKKNNKKLNDKTNREGLIHDGTVTDDFIAIIQALLAYVRQGTYTQYINKFENKKVQDIYNKNVVSAGLIELKNILNNMQETFKIAMEKIKQAIKTLDDLQANYKLEKEYLVKRAEMMEGLAAVGLSVETASHDMMSVVRANARNLETIIDHLNNSEKINRDELLSKISDISEENDFIEGQLKNVQTLFTSAKRKKRAIDIKEMIVKVMKIYEGFLNDNNIKLKIIPEGISFTANTTRSVLLQCFLNLLDNAIYWLKQNPKDNRMIEISLDIDRKIVIFSDNGPGVDIEDTPYIFEAFYSAKGEEGRGLGLYITRQLLEKHGYSINLVEEDDDKILSGANFILNFSDGEKND